MNDDKNICVGWAANASGYVVQTLEDGEVTEEYKAGNSPHCSNTYLPDNEGVGIEQVREWAEGTAKETANALGRPNTKYVVFEDKDLLEELDNP